MTPEDVRHLLRAYEDACQSALDAYRMCKVARRVVSESRRLLDRAQVVSEYARIGDA